MLEILKNWITTMLCTGIFFTFIKMIIPNSKLAKYIYSLIGVVTIVTLVMPVLNLMNLDDFSIATKSVISNIENEALSNNANIINIDNIETQNTLDKNLKNEFSKNIKNNIQSILEQNNIESKMISVIVDDSYQIQKINIKIERNTENSTFTIEKIFSIIEETYNIDNGKVVIEEI